jgi:hypothetical protein
MTAPLLNLELACRIELAAAQAVRELQRERANAQCVCE